MGSFRSASASTDVLWKCAIFPVPPCFTRMNDAVPSARVRSRTHGKTCESLCRGYVARSRAALSHLIATRRVGSGDPRPHADYVTASDFPQTWREQAITVDVEAKAKERAVLALRDAVMGASLASYASPSR